MIPASLAAVVCVLLLSLAWIEVERTRAKRHEAIADLRKANAEAEARFNATLAEQRSLMARLTRVVEAYQMRTRRAALKNGWLTPQELDADEVDPS